VESKRTKGQNQGKSQRKGTNKGAKSQGTFRDMHGGVPSPQRKGRKTKKKGGPKGAEGKGKEKLGIEHVAFEKNHALQCKRKLRVVHNQIRGGALKKNIRTKFMIKDQRVQGKSNGQKAGSVNSRGNRVKKG